MKTINDIIKMMYENPREYCPEYTCYDCLRYTFCWCDTRTIALDYIKREGII